MTEPQPDPIVQAFQPDRDLLARAVNERLSSETHEQKFMRQRWEHAVGATRVAMDSLREICPSYEHQLDPDERIDLQEALKHAEELWRSLDQLDHAMLGETVISVMHGAITSPQQLYEALEPQDWRAKERELDERYPAAPGSPLLRGKVVDVLKFVCEHPGQPLPDQDASSTQYAIDELIQNDLVEWRHNRLHATAKGMDTYQ